MYVCVCWCISVWLCICVYLYLCLCVYVYVYIYMCICVFVCVHVYMCLSLCVCACLSVCIWVCVSMCVCFVGAEWAVLLQTKDPFANICIHVSEQETFQGFFMQLWQFVTHMGSSLWGGVSALSPGGCVTCHRVQPNVTESRLGSVLPWDIQIQSRSLMLVCDGVCLTELDLSPI